MHDWREDVNNYELPRDVKAFEKLKCELRHGMRIGWFYAEDARYAEECDNTIDDLRKDPPFSGLVIVREACDPNRVDYDTCIIVMDRYPAEKCEIEAVWMAIDRVLDSDNLVEVVEVKHQ